MTVSYSAQISSANKIGAFLKLLLVWQGSVYKLIWFDLLVYLALYFVISVVYRFILDIEQQSTFEQLSLFCDVHSASIPLTFVLAFYVSHVVSRWWAQWEAIPWPDSLAFKVNCYCQGKDDHSRMLRRQLTRYGVLSIVETLRLVSSKVKKRFPTYNHLVEAGLMTETEALAFQQVQGKSEFLNYSHWIPLTWAGTITTHAYEQGYIEKAKFASDINEELNKLRGLCGTVLSYDWLVTMAVYAFFGSTLLGRQWLNSNKHIEGKLIKKLYHTKGRVTVSVQFIFYVGWLKVAEALLNPFGEDDEDFDTNWMVDRHLQLSYMMVDEVGQYPPHPERDPYWDIGIPAELPYTVASLPFRARRSETGAEELKIPLAKQKPVYTSYLSVNKESSSVGNSFSRLNQLVAGMVRKVSSCSSAVSAPTNQGPPLKPSTLKIKKRRSKSTHSAPPGGAFSSLKHEGLETSANGSLSASVDSLRAIRRASPALGTQLSPVKEETGIVDYLRTCSKERNSSPMKNFGNEDVIIHIREE